MEFVPGSTLTEFGIKGTNYCGPGYSDGKLGGKANGGGEAVNEVDKVCRRHDKAYEEAEKSTTSAADRLTADSKLLEEIRDLVRGNALSPSESEIAAAMLAAFMYKRRYYDVPTALYEDAKRLLKDALDSLGINDRNPLLVGFSPSSSLRYRDIAPGANTGYGPSRTAIPIPPRRDPLVLDLDGDGIETLGIDTANPILFDHAANGVRIATGWLKSDDAFLVSDRDHDGTIDSGAELFSDATPLDVGGIAADGFAALAQEDINHDGVVDANDADWANLRLWRDLNQDGIAQADELSTLASQHINALHLARTVQNTAQANGNRIADTGVYVRDDASTGTMGDIDLVTNPFVSRFTDPIALTDAARDLADMQGAGMVRSLREAASLDAWLVGAVQSLVGMSRAQMLSSLDAIISHWAGTSTQKTSAAAADDKGFRLVYLPPGMSVADYWAIRGLDDNAVAASLAASNPTEFARLQALRTQQETLSAQIGVLERFNAQAFVTVGDAGVTTEQGSVILAQTGAQLGVGAVTGRYAIVALNTAQTPLLAQAYASLKQSAYDALASQTRLKPYLDGIRLSIDTNGFRLDYNALDLALDARYAVDKASALADYLDLRQYGQVISPDFAPHLASLFGAWAKRAVDNGQFDALRAAMKEACALCGVATPTMLGGTAGGDALTASSGDQLVVGGGGNDTITSSGSGNDALYGGDGNDTIVFSGYASTTVEGGSGDDTIRTDNFNYCGAARRNTLSGGSGNDRISAGAGTDTYLFNRGDGNDTIFDYGESNFSPVGDDTLVFGEGIRPDDVLVSRAGDNLVAAVKDAANPLANDQVTVEGWFWGNVYRIERFLFADGACLTSNELTVMANTISGSGANDILSGPVGDNRIYGFGGNDTIVDSGGNDTIDGGDGDDVIIDQECGTNVISGGDGNDKITYCSYANNTIDGGKGNDTIQANSFSYGNASYRNVFSGGPGNDRLTASGSADTYLFNRGDGSDSLYDFGYSSSSQPGSVAIVFGPDIAADQLWFRHIGNDLRIDVIGTSDNITVEGWYYGSTYHIEQLKSGDGKVLLDTKVELLVQAMAGFAPPAVGQTALPQPYRDALTPVLAPNWQ
ncbi:calcium-binding protein [uncultured Propionivibrio sp.]|uniref:calcium-binding protein n=1 Tax=uncultured Propionivibrio sp. TaxID=426737 RepID=UPI0029BFD4F2|nr:calcium-binding protein [uncultured Propionivibrio sp.]